MLACAAQARAHGADRNVELARDFVVVHLLDADEPDDLAMLPAQGFERALHVAHLVACLLPALDRRGALDHAVLRQQRPALLGLVDKDVVQDGHQPGAHVRARLELVDIVDGAHQALLHQVVRFLRIPGEEHGIAAQSRNLQLDELAELLVQHSDLTPMGVVRRGTARRRRRHEKPSQAGRYGSGERSGFHSSLEGTKTKLGCFPPMVVSGRDFCVQTTSRRHTSKPAWRQGEFICPYASAPW